MLKRKLKNATLAALLVSTTGTEGLGMVCTAAVRVGLIGAGTWYCRKAITSAGTSVTRSVPPVEPVAPWGTASSEDWGTVATRRLDEMLRATPEPPLRPPNFAVPY